GLSNYVGDIIPASITLDNAQLSYGLFYRHQVSDKIALRAGLTLGKLKADDDDYEERGTRGYNFETSYTQLLVLGEYHLNGKARYDEDGVFQKQTTYYVLAGIGATFFDPETGGLPAAAPERLDEYSTGAFTIPVGIGVRVPFSENLSIGVELGALLTFTDYLDGISESANPDQGDNMGHFEVNFGYAF
ncbi:MAG: DUF6089 family protein, partial [Bacteroidota bacterium]